MKRIIIFSILLLCLVGVSRAVTVLDHATTGADDEIYNNLTDVATGNPPAAAASGDLYMRYGLDAGESIWQEFTLSSQITLDSLYIGYNQQQTSGMVRLALDLNGNTVGGPYDYDFSGIVLSGLQTDGDNNGPVHYLQFDLSDENVVIPAGQHRYIIWGESEDGSGFIIAPIRNLGDTYSGGDGNFGDGDHIFAITQNLTIPAPAANVSPADGTQYVQAGSTTLDWDAGDDPSGAALGYLVTCEQNLAGTVTVLADAVDVALGTTEHVITTVANATYTWRVDTYYGDYPTNPDDIVQGTVWTFDMFIGPVEEFKIDFTQTGGPVEAGWQGYFADHEVLSSFTQQNYSAFGGTVSILPTWSSGAVNATSQMYDRGGDDGTDAEDLLRDWLGTDARQDGDPMTLTISGLPVGNYVWKSYHHDTENQTGIFDVTVNDATGTAVIPDIDISSGWGDGMNTLANVTTLSTAITSDGNPITLTFDCQAAPTDDILTVFFVMNAFELSKMNIASAPAPADSATDVSVSTDLTWVAPTEYTPSSYDVYFGTDPYPYNNPKYTVASESFSPHADLEHDTVYYWVVDSYDGPTKHVGRFWSFETFGYADYVAGNMMMINDNAGWCWYQDEKIIYDPVAGSVLASTATDASGFDGSARDGDIDSTSFNIATGLRTRVIMGDHPSYGSGDDHNVGAFWIRPDGRYLHMYTGHNDSSRNSYYRISSSPNDGSTWDTETYFNWYAAGNPDTDGNITYSNLLYMANEGTGQGRLYNIGRESQRSPNIAYSDDWGVTWTYAGKLSLPENGVGYSNGYFKFISNGTDRIDFIGTEHHPHDYNTSIYHGYIKGGKSYNSFDVVIDNNIFDENAPAPADFTPIFLASPVASDSYHHAWTVELQLDQQGYPIAFYSTRYGTDVLVSRLGDADHRLFYARFDGAQWHSTEIAKMGWGINYDQSDYTGLGAIHPDNAGLIYISTPFDPRDDSALDHHEIFKGISADQGATWQWTQITFDSTADNLRPAIPSWDADNTAVFWLRGHYPFQRDYDQTLVGMIDRDGESMGLTNYIDADGNTTLTDGSALTATGPDAGFGSADNQWHEYTAYGNEGSCLVSNENGTEDAPALKTTVTGLADGIYDVFGYFWADPDQDWRISGGFAQSDMLVFRRSSSQQANADQFFGSVDTLGDSTALYRVYIGRREVTGGAAIDVYFDDLAGSASDGSQRTAYDGIGIAHVLYGDLSEDGIVDMYDMAELGRGWQSLYTMDDLLNIANDWLK